MFQLLIRVPTMSLMMLPQVHLALSPMGMYISRSLISTANFFLRRLLRRVTNSHPPLHAVDSVDPRGPVLMRPDPVHRLDRQAVVQAVRETCGLSSMGKRKRLLVESA